MRIPVTDSSPVAIRILSAGLLTTVQDLGRPGFQRYGMPVGGAMDPWSLRCANRLVGNRDDAAALEVTAKGPELRFESGITFAVTGASFRLTLDGADVPMWTRIRTGAGSILKFGARLRGARAYLACAGGIDVPLVMGSRATHIPSQIGGVEGRALRAGDRLRCGTARSIDRDRRDWIDALPPAMRPELIPCPTLRVILGPHGDRFAPEALGVLTSSIYTLSPQSDRMGYRLEGPSLDHLNPDAGTMLTEPTPVGAIQVPPNRRPILLMADCQTTGGYPAIAVLIAADRRMAAQLLPGDHIRFTAIDRQEAVRCLAEQSHTLDAILPPIPSVP